MKIIAKTDGGFIAEISRTEIANIMGESWFDDQKMKDKTRIGDTVNISESWNQLHLVKSINESKQVLLKETDAMKKKIESIKIPKIERAPKP